LISKGSFSEAVAGEIGEEELSTDAEEVDGNWVRPGWERP
jgi:hypothetical protein